jgi:FlaA1/EpsC-like NDP-sugar epimerase
MLIPEAVQLVLIAAASDSGGELFVLEMGEQIKIADLAENLIRLSGFIPHEEIKIIYSGLRPGEKLYEELFDDSENIIPTSHEKLRIAVPDAVPSMDDLNTCISQLERIVSDNLIEELVPVIQSIVPNFKRFEI